MSQHDAGDGDAEYARVGEVGQAQPARLVLLTEDHILLGADQRSPCAHAPFKRAPNAGADLRMASEQQPFHLDHRLLAVSPRTVRILFWWKVGFKDRL